MTLVIFILISRILIIFILQVPKFVIFKYTCFLIQELFHK